MKRKILAAIFSSGVIALSSGAMFPENDDRYIEYVYTVAPGDTLYGIGKYVAGENEDVRDVVRRMKADNNISDSNIVPGQELKVRVVRIGG